MAVARQAVGERRTVAQKTYSRASARATLAWKVSSSAHAPRTLAFEGGKISAIRRRASGAPFSVTVLRSPVPLPWPGTGTTTPREATPLTRARAIDVAFVGQHLADRPVLLRPARLRRDGSSGSPGDGRIGRCSQILPVTTRAASRLLLAGQ